MIGDFSQVEGAKYKPAFETFYTNSEQNVKFTSVNKFEGISSYFSYFPTDQLSEQKLEQFWWHHQNKKLADKRADEEMAAYLREWAAARGRMEAEIQRRKEHLNEATNFEKARGFVRTNWKTKNWNPNDDPTQEDSSSDSEDNEIIYEDEKKDVVQEIMSPSSRGRSRLESDGRDNQGEDDNATSLNMTRQLSDTKQRRRLYQHKPIIVDVDAS